MASRGWERVTPQDVTRRALTQAEGRTTMPQKRRSKYNAKPTTVDGIRFASAKEAARYRELKLLVTAGAISRLILQPRYGLYVRPFVREGIDHAELFKCGDYVGDFQYETVLGLTVLEDVKSVATKTAVYRLKKRIVEALYGIQIREV